MSKIKYRLGYDRLFLTKHPEQIDYKGKIIDSIMLDIIILIFDKDGNEFLFEDDKMTEQRLYFENGDSAYVSEFYKVYFDRKNQFLVKANQALQLISGYTFKYKIQDYWYYDNQSHDPTQISEEEFRCILKDNIDKWDCSDNAPTQSTAYFTEEVKEITNLAIKYPSVEVKREYNLSIAIDNNGCVETVKIIKNKIINEQDIRELASQHVNKLIGKQFILLDTFENGRHIDSGKMYFNNSVKC